MSHVPTIHVWCQAPDMAEGDSASWKVPALETFARRFGHVRCLAPDMSAGDMTGVGSTEPASSGAAGFAGGGAE